MLTNMFSPRIATTSVWIWDWLVCLPEEVSKIFSQSEVLSNSDEPLLVIRS